MAEFNLSYLYEILETSPLYFNKPKDDPPTSEAYKNAVIECLNTVDEDILAKWIPHFVMDKDLLEEHLSVIRERLIEVIADKPKPLKSRNVNNNVKEGLVSQSLTDKFKHSDMTMCDGNDVDYFCSFIQYADQIIRNKVLRYVFYRFLSSLIIDAMDGVISGNFKYYLNLQCKIIESMEKGTHLVPNGVDFINYVNSLDLNSLPRCAVFDVKNILEEVVLVFAGDNTLGMDSVNFKNAFKNIRSRHQVTVNE